MADRSLDELAAAVIDREDVDWREVGTAGSSSRAGVVGALQILSSHAPSGATGMGSRRNALPGIMAAGLALVTVVVVFAIVATLVALLVNPTAVQPAMATLLAVFGLTGGYLLVTSRRDGRARALAGTYLSLGAFFADSAVDIGAVPAALAWIRALSPEAFFPCFLWHFAREFPAALRFSGTDRLAGLGARLSGMLAVALNVLNPWYALWGLPSWLAVASVRDVANGSGFYGAIFLSAMPALVVIPLRSRFAPVEEQRRVRLFLLSMAIGLAPATVIVTIEALVPGGGAWFDAHVGRSVMQAIVWGGLLAMPLTAAYALRASRVLDLRQTFGLGLRYVLVRWLIDRGAIAGLVPILVHVYAARSQPLNDTLTSSALRPWLALELVAVVLWLTRRWTVAWLDRLLSAVQTDAARELNKLTAALATIRSPLELGELMRETCQRVFQAPVAVLLRAGHRFVPMDASADPLPEASLLPVLLTAAEGPCRVGSDVPTGYYWLVSSEDRRWIDQSGAVVACVLPGAQADKPVGAVTLGLRRNGRPYSTEDMEWLGTATAAVRLASQSDGSTTDVASEQVLAAQCRACLSVTPWVPNGPSCSCGSPLSPAALPMSFLGRYDLSQLLGVGGMGVVYLVTDRMLDRRLAAKTLLHVSPDAVDRLRAEAKTMASLTHPHIAVLYGMEMWKHTPLLLSEFLERGSLAQWMGSRPVPTADAARALAAILDALEYLHSRGLVHGDIKPSNVAQAHDGTFKLLDFGLATLTSSLDSGGPWGGQVLGGTPAYASPELAMGVPVSYANDIWSTSVVAFELATGRYPFRLSGRSVDYDSYPDASELAGARAFAASAFARDTRARPQTIADLRRLVAATLDPSQTSMIA